MRSTFKVLFYVSESKDKNGIVPIMGRVTINGSKDISFHCTRHGFATLALSKGVPIESVSRVLGHTNITTTQRYAKITTENIDKDLTMFGNRLNQSFSEISIVM